MNEAVNKVVDTAGVACTEYADNDWDGADIPLSDGKSLRLAQEGGSEEEIEMFMFDDRMMLEWRGSFSASCPVNVVSAAARAAMEGRTE